MPNETNRKNQSRIDAWFNAKYRPGATKLLMWAAVAMAICAVWVYHGMDNDSYYMIPQGNEILESGIPEYNTYTYHGSRTVVQQWLYCVGMAIADRAPGNLGLMGFMLAQALLLFAMLEQYLRRPIKDPFWSWTATIALLSSCSLNYFASLRPENITLILMLAQCMVLERYRDTGKKAWLLAQPAIMLLEANLHVAMWPIHACIYLAYFVPAMFPWLQKKLKLQEKAGLDICPGCLQRDWIGPDPAAYAAAVVSLLLALASPYGIDGVTYLFKSMPVFNVIAMSEQQAPVLVSTLSIMDLGIFLCTWILARKKAIGATEACMALGLAALSCLNYHNSMFLAIAAANLIRPALRMLAGKDPAKAADMVPNGAKAILYAGVAAAAVATCAVTVPGLPQFKDKPGMDPAIEYVMENREPGTNVLNNLNAGPMLEYAGARGLYGDTRPELLLDTIGRTDENPCIVLPWLCSGYMPEEIKENYGSVEAYLEKNDISIVMDEDRAPVMAWLAGWLEASDGWEKVSFDSALEAEEDDRGSAYCVWVRR